jgi:hypothetical protein
MFFKISESSSLYLLQSITLPVGARRGTNQQVNFGAESPWLELPFLCALLLIVVKHDSFRAIKPRLTSY